MKATLHLHQKRVFKNGSVLEMKLWEIKKSGSYPDGIRYSLIFVNPKSGKKVLMDNHNPKGHHYHIDEEEFDYDFKDINQLIEDFKSLVKVHMGVLI